MVMLLYEWKHLSLSHYVVKFGERRRCGSGDMMFLICHVVLGDNVIKGSCE